MKFLRFGEMGAEKPGVLDGAGRIRDLSGIVDDLAGDVLADLPDVTPESLPIVEGEPRIGAPVGRVGKFMCIGLNYSDHAAEAGMDLPKEPILFMKATSAICGPQDTVRLPRGSEKSDWEVELAVVIGKRAKYVSEARRLIMWRGIASPMMSRSGRFRQSAAGNGPRAKAATRSGRWGRGL